jgi:hypothetical protein
VNSSITFEIIGYTASAMVAISLMMNSIVKLRVINMIGAYPVAVLNFTIVLIDLYYLRETINSKAYFLQFKLLHGEGQQTH